MTARSSHARKLLVVPLLALGVLAFPLLGGCGSRPVAPALRDEPVYQNDRLGFRFLAPEGWTLSAKAGDIPGGGAKERLLVRYHPKAGGDKGATMEVTMADLPADTDLVKHLGAPAYGAKTWRDKGRPETLDINGVSATRYTLSAKVGNDDMLREVVVFRRGERVYFFTGLFAPGDKKIRDQVRRSVVSTIWKS